MKLDVPKNLKFNFKFKRRDDIYIVFLDRVFFFKKSINLKNRYIFVIFNKSLGLFL